MRSDVIPALGGSTPCGSTRRSASRCRLPSLVMALLVLAGGVVLAGGISIAGIAQSGAATGSATMVVDQCNDHAPKDGAATTRVKCSVSVVNTINGVISGSTITVTRLCTLGPCGTPNGTFASHSTGLVTVIRQCNNSDNDAAHAIECNVNITNNINASIPGALPLKAPAISQCQGSGRGGGAVLDCPGVPAAGTGATVTQCNHSGNGGGAAVHCAVDPNSKVSRVIPITVDQCNSTGNPGGSVLTCKASIITNISRTTATVAPTKAPIPKPTKAKAPKPTPTHTAARTPSPAPTATPSATSPAVTSAGQTGSGPAAGTEYSGPLALSSALVLVAAIGALVLRPSARREVAELFRRLTRRL